MVFGRRKRKDADEVDDTVDAVEAEALPAPIPAPQGPWDIADAPDAPRLDLGSLMVPVPEGLEIRVDVSPEGQVVAAVAVDGSSQMQINAFAAPRSAGLWAEVRDEIASSLRKQGGGAEEVEGPFGPELRARVPGEGGQAAPARFMGTDGPRWFIRGLVTGPAATDPIQAGRLHEVFRGCVVVRGGDAMAPRDALPMHLPRDATAAIAEAGDVEAAEVDAEAPTADDFNPFERGPEITESR